MDDDKIEYLQNLLADRVKTAAEACKLSAAHSAEVFSVLSTLEHALPGELLVQYPVGIVIPADLGCDYHQMLRQHRLLRKLLIHSS